MATDAQRRAVKKWRAREVKRLAFDFYKEKDADILDAFEKSGNRTKLVKDSVREHLAREKEEQQ